MKAVFSDILSGSPAVLFLVQDRIGSPTILFTNPPNDTKPPDKIQSEGIDAGLYGYYHHFSIVDHQANMIDLFVVIIHQFGGNSVLYILLYDSSEISRTVFF